MKNERIKEMKYYILIIVLLILGYSGFTQSNKGKELDQYLETAAKNNPAVKASYNQYLAALEKVPQVGALTDPQGSMGFFLKPMALVDGNQIGNIGVMQMFPWFGTLRLTKDEASMMAKARFKQFEDEKALLFFNVKSSWYQLTKYKHQIELINENIGLLESYEKLALVKFQSPGGNAASNGGKGEAGNQGMERNSQNPENGGMNDQKSTLNKQQFNSNMPSGGGGEMLSKQTGLSDVLRVRMEILDQKNQLELLKDKLKTETANFNSFLNRDLNTLIEIEDTIKMEKLTVPVLTVADSIILHNPMLGMLDAERQSYSAMAEKSRKMGLPMVGLGVNYMIIQKQSGNPSMMNGKDMVMPMVNFSIPIYRKKYNSMQKEAKLLEESSQQKSNDLKNSLLVQYHQFVEEINDAERRIELYREQLDLAKKTSNLLLAGFSSGSADYEEVLRMQYKVLDYGFKHLEAVADYNIAVAKADRLMNLVEY